MGNSLLLGAVALSAACAACVAAEPAAASVLERSLRSAWSGARQVRYADARDDPGWVRTQALFAQLLRGVPSNDLRGEADALGWTLRRGEAGGVAWTVLEEKKPRRSGRGLYAFAPAGGRHAIQAPHVPSDLHTGEIALRLGQEGHPRAIAWNTVPRQEADLPHRDDSPLHAFSRAYAAAFPDERIVQLHGFDGERRAAEGGRGPGAILSATQAPPTPAMRELAACLRERVEPHTLLFGEDARELGGTRNRIARELLAGGFQGFVHLEMGLPLRESLRDNAQRRGALLDCLGVPR